MNKIQNADEAAHLAVGLYTGFTDLLFAWQMLGYDSEHWARTRFIRILRKHVDTLSKKLNRTSIEQTERKISSEIWERVDRVLREIREGGLAEGDRYASSLQRIIFIAAWTWWYLKKEAAKTGRMLVPSNSAIEPINGVLFMLHYDASSSLLAKDVLKFMEDT